MKYLLFTIVLLLSTVHQGFNQIPMLEIDGDLKIGSTESKNPQPGTIRWTGSDFEGWNGNQWVSLTSGKIVGTVTDVQGNVYGTVKIGFQTWMTENLRTTEYRNGDDIWSVPDANNWSGLDQPQLGAYVSYGNNGNYNHYGKLYNWYAVNDSRKLCPDGWHVTSSSDLSYLLSYLGGSSNAGLKMKETGPYHWTGIANYATNETAFSALPGGRRLEDGTFADFGDTGVWWTRNEENATKAKEFSMVSGNIGLYEASQDKRRGHSVRCVKDYF